MISLRHQAGFVGAALLALAGCADAPTPSAANGMPVAVGMPGTADMGATEAALLAASHGRARRMGDDLTLTYLNGKTRTFRNNNKGCEDGPDDCEGYILIGDLPAFHWFVLFQTAYEGGRFLLVDDHGGLPTEIPYWPTFSADGSRLLIQDDDVSDFFPGNTLEIWRREGNRMEPEWIANPDESDTGVPMNGFVHTRLVDWRGDRITLEFTVDETTNTLTKVTTPERKWKAALVRAADGWHLNARAPKP